MKPHTLSSPDLRSAGFTLVEVMVALAVLAVSFLALNMMYIGYVRTDKFRDERRIATQAAVERLEGLRQQVTFGLQSFPTLLANYPPVPTVGAPTDANGLPYSAFAVPGLQAASTDPVRNQYVGTITFITPSPTGTTNFLNQGQYGYDYSVSPPQLMGIDVDGQGSNQNALCTYKGALPAPFPMNIYNPDGSINFLPVVVTVRWYGAYGPQRIDLFTIIFNEKRF